MENLVFTSILHIALQGSRIYPMSLAEAQVGTSAVTNAIHKTSIYVICYDNSYQPDNVNSGYIECAKCTSVSNTYSLK